MSTAHKPPTPTRILGRAGASFRYGYREVRKKLPDGGVDWVRVPLTLEDVLHPRFGDVHVLTSSHTRDCRYLANVLGGRVADDPAVLVAEDLGIFWDDPRLKHHSPDISVIVGVRKQDWVTFHVKKEKVRPVLLVEVTSRATRINDVETKVEQYAQAGVPFYVIADGPGIGKRRRLTLISYRLANGVYKRVDPDDRGRVWLEPVKLWLGVALDPSTGGDRLVLIDPATDEEIGDYAAISEALEAEAAARARAERQAAAEVLAREQAERQAAAEAVGRAQAERVAAAEAVGRAQAERVAASESEKRAQAEDRIRELEAELRRLRGRKSP